jgi:hypothetical protein
VVSDKQDIISYSLATLKMLENRPPKAIFGAKFKCKCCHYSYREFDGCIKERLKKKIKRFFHSLDRRIGRSFKRWNMRLQLYAVSKKDGHAVHDP